MIRQYDRQIIFTEKGSYFSYYETSGSDPSFPVFTLNSSKGNVAKGQGQLVRNNPFVVWEGVNEVVASNVREKRNFAYISKRVQPSLDNVDLKSAITYDYEYKYEYWLNIGDIVWIYNYRLDVWYKYDNISATCFIDIDNVLYFGTANGQIMKFASSLRDDNDVAINAYYVLKFFDFGKPYARKYSSRMWANINPEAKSETIINWKTDVKSDTKDYTVTYNIATFSDTDFNNFSFNTSNDPQPNRFKIKAKKYTFLEITISSPNTNKSSTFIGLYIATRYGGESK